MRDAVHPALGTTRMDMDSEQLPRESVRCRPRLLRRLLALLLLAALAALLWPRIGLALQALYTRVRFGIATVHSPTDRDRDLLDDYSDIMLSARAYVRTNPAYDAEYYAGGYPPAGRGVCADVVWQALRGAGYDFKAMLDADIAAHSGRYPLPDGMPDTNIDFRRVVNLEVYFQRHALSLTTDTTRVAEWQPGDVVFYEGHVGIVSDRRNADGRPWIIHHTGHGAFEEDALNYKPVTGHYRWIGE